MLTFLEEKWVKEQVMKSSIRTKELETAIIKCLDDNAHLADGDNCTLMGLKKVMPNWDTREDLYV